ncbi:MAG TPA: hypothetical protein VNH18_07780 [Bryobacteraceae bacterium]|nr:hypothetical protein [Bryobacteraceae bacterium]
MLRSTNLVKQPGFRNSGNFDAGAIHKLITIDTPHLGTPIATDYFDAENTCVRQILAWLGQVALEAVLVDGKTLHRLR